MRGHPRETVPSFLPPVLSLDDVPVLLKGTDSWLWLQKSHT